MIKNNIKSKLNLPNFNNNLTEHVSDNDEDNESNESYDLNIKFKSKKLNLNLSQDDIFDSQNSNKVYSNFRYKNVNKISNRMIYKKSQKINFSNESIKFESDFNSNPKLLSPDLKLNLNSDNDTNSNFMSNKSLIRNSSRRRRSIITDRTNNSIQYNLTNK